METPEKIFEALTEYAAVSDEDWKSIQAKMMLGTHATRTFIDNGTVRIETISYDDIVQFPNDSLKP